MLLLVTDLISLEGTRWEWQITYAEIPTLSRTPAVATIAAAVVKPKLYSQGSTGSVPVAVRALRSVVTWTCSELPIDFKLTRSSCERPSATKSESGNCAKPCW